MHSLLKNLAVSALVGTAVLGSVYPATLNALTTADEYKIPSGFAFAFNIPVPAKEPVLEVTEPDALDLWLERLIQKESRGKAVIKILDVNHKYSYGCLQFQEWTFRAFGEKYGLVKKGAKLEPLIYDCELQKQIAKRMIQDDYKLWQSWYTSVVIRDLGLPPRS